VSVAGVVLLSRIATGRHPHDATPVSGSVPDAALFFGGSECSGLVFSPLLRRVAVAKQTLRVTWAKASFGDLARKLATAFVALNSMMTELYYGVTVIQTATPVNAGTTVLTDAVNDAHLVCTPAGTIAAHTFTFPTNANSRIGQIVTISTSAEITAVTFSGAGLTITEDVTGLLAGAAITFQKVAASVWRRIG